MQINLLTWREQARQAKKNQFLLIILMSIGITLFFVLAIHFYLSQLVSSQKQRNNFLDLEVNLAQADLANLNKQKKAQSSVLPELQFIFSLREKSYQSVALLNEITKLMPERVTLIRLERADRTVLLEGQSETSLQVTNLMQSLARSSIFTQPILTDIIAKADKNETADNTKYFKLTVQIRDNDLNEKL